MIRVKYIFLDDNYQTGHFLMKDIEPLEEVRVIYKDRMLKNPILNIFCRIYLSQKIKRYIKLPFKSFFYNMIIKNLSRNEKICFVLITAWYDIDLLLFLKRKYKNCFLALILRDTVQSNEKRGICFSIESAKKQFNFILSYDSYDVEKFGLKFAPVFISMIDKEEVIEYPKVDLSFVAMAKDRLSLIQSIGEKVNACGGNISFYLMGVDQEKQKPITGVHYIEKPLSRIECLSKELAANCILEVLKGDAHANTLRYWEAILYNKKFITNWEGIKSSPYYNEKYMRYYQTATDIDMSFITEIVNVDYMYKNELSPIHLLEILDANCKSNG